MNALFCASGIIRNKNNQVLLTSRKNKNILNSYWEFPGGRLENGESFFQALIREVKEELNIKIIESEISPLIFIGHKYRNFHLFMHVFTIKNWRGNLKSIDNENLKWRNVNYLKKDKILPANKKIIDLLV